MGIVAVNGLRMTAYHGVFEQERIVGNEFVVSVSLNVPMIDKAMDSDNLDDTVNYAEIIEIIKKEMLKPSKLLEHVAGRLKKAIISQCPYEIAGGEIKIEKLAPPVPAELESVSYTTKW